MNQTKVTNRNRISAADLLERPGMDFWLSQPYASKASANGQVIPYEVVSVALVKGYPTIKIRPLEIISNKGQVKVQPYAEGDYAAPVVTVRPDPDYMYRKNGGVIDSKGNRYDLHHRPLMAIGGQFIYLD